MGAGVNNKIRTALIVLISLVWSSSFVATIFEHGYKPPPEINMAFMGVVGMLTATYQKDSRKPPKDDEP
jgi:hypothetical protein